MRTSGKNAQTTNFGWWIWGDHISSPNKINVIAAVETKDKNNAIK